MLQCARCTRLLTHFQATFWSLQKSGQLFATFARPLAWPQEKREIGRHSPIVCVCKRWPDMGAIQLAAN